MPGFNYGGFGDGSGWSRERGEPRSPIGESNNNTGGNSNSGGGSVDQSTLPPTQQQINAIKNDRVTLQKLLTMQQAARQINPYAKVTVESISKSGVMGISITEVTADQAYQLGLTKVMGFDANGTRVALGDMPTGKSRRDGNKLDHNYAPVSAEAVASSATVDDTWTQDPLTGAYFTSKIFSGHTLKSLTITGPYTFRLVYDVNPDVSVDVTVINGDPNNLAVTLNYGGPQGNTPKASQSFVRDLIAFKMQEERDVLLKTSELIVSVGTEASKYLGEQYKNIANEIAADVRNFQGKTIRNVNDAMASLMRIMANPSMQPNAADRAAIINAWNYLNATDMAYKLGFLGKAFSFADIVLKVEKVRQLTIVAYQTGDWSGLALEIEAWVLSGMATGIALGILATIAPYVAATISLPLTALTIVGIIGISLAASLIDDKLVEKINNELVRPAY